MKSARFIIAFHNIFPSCVGYTRVAFASGNNEIAACISGYIDVGDDQCIGNKFAVLVTELVVLVTSNLSPALLFHQHRYSLHILEYLSVSRSNYILHKNSNSFRCILPASSPAAIPAD